MAIWVPVDHILSVGLKLLELINKWIVTKLLLVSIGSHPHFS
jgi:hypothetical protein